MNESDWEKMGEQIAAQFKLVDTIKSADPLMMPVSRLGTWVWHVDVELNVHADGTQTCVDRSTVTYEDRKCPN